MINDFDLTDHARQSALRKAYAALPADQQIHVKEAAEILINHVKATSTTQQMSWGMALEVLASTGIFLSSHDRRKR